MKTQLSAVTFPQLQALERLHLSLLNARLRKRKRLSIPAEEMAQYEEALKAAFPPMDLTSHGFKGEPS